MKKVIGLCGSLRKGSKNLQLLRAAQEIGEGLNIEIKIEEYSDLPLYNMDVQEQGMPETVTRIGNSIQEADAVLIVSPEYNYSVPGPLKNLIDWISRLSPQPFESKPVAIMGTSPGMVGTARMQYHLRQVMVFLDALPINKPEVMIGQYQDKFDDQGKLVDEKAKEMVERSLKRLAEWADTVGK